MPLESLSEESDYEYEYDESEMETFYVNLDLTSCNGRIRPPRQRSAASTDSLGMSVDPANSQPGSPMSHAASSQDQEMATDPDLDTQLQNQIQIMELHSPNPIVSYQNQIFSCSWADPIGTDMMFSLPDDGLDPPPLRQTRDFDLISTTRVRILGQRAHLISASGPSQSQRLRSAGTSNGQAHFIECLMGAKRAKGEEDTVRTVFPNAQTRNQNLDEKLQGWARTEGMVAELESLYQKIRDGDFSALKRLDEIYARFDMASRRNIGSGTPAASGPSSTAPAPSHPGDIEHLPDDNVDNSTLFHVPEPSQSINRMSKSP
ncbi:hypothetical protein PRK78_003421 [Emydomyces testavorans]|uniref:Transcription factor TFIIIC triple barrel domain-containing protein n=1 Tax=Emydomyces testavorans TaxID=2070801 RepID=A0AAF0DG09_9EURO|nr:hypothetical protein PRK78_003421 [Emydomyces testavorans]